LYTANKTKKVNAEERNEKPKYLERTWVILERNRYHREDMGLRKGRTMRIIRVFGDSSSRVLFIQWLQNA
jgi:hypothetical protein